jgi:mannose-6-phosphate isomerase-like protein (cupin superfamily)
LAGIKWPGTNPPPGAGVAFGHIFAGMKFDKANYVKKDILSSDKIHMGVLLFEPGQGQKSHTHAGSDKVYYVHEGVAKVTVAKETNDLGPGACAMARAGEPHEIWNKSRDRLIVVVFTAPPAPEHAKQASGPVPRTSSGQ